MSSDKETAYHKVMNKLFDVKEKLTDGEYKGLVDLMAETRREDQNKEARKRKFVRIEYIKIKARAGCNCEECDECYNEPRLKNTKKSKIVCISDSVIPGIPTGPDSCSFGWLKAVEDSARDGLILRDCIPKDEVKKVTHM